VRIAVRIAFTPEALAEQEGEEEVKDGSYKGGECDGEKNSKWKDVVKL